MKNHKKIAAQILILPMLSMFLYFTFQQENVIEPESKFSQVRIFAFSDNDFWAMANSGLLIDHAIRKPGEFMDAWLSGEEISRLKKSGVPYQILIDDWQQYYESQPRMSAAEIDAQSKEVYEKDNITHSIFGSMGGYMTYSEVVSKLDSMRMWYPQFISVKFSIGTSYEGRQIWAVRVTKNPDAPTGRPEAMYHALIHAREPESMETQFYYMFWLFENYDSDPLARFILNSREIYWVPIYNVDGYVYNQTTNPNGGGMWRCNRHFTSGSCGPVDLNRNYGTYQYWNSPNGGSSTDPCNGGQGTYRGTNPFSEPELQAMMNFVNSRNFNSGVDAHAFGNYLIKPWAWIDPQVTPDDNKYEEYFTDMKASNPIYRSGTSSQTLGYYIRGGSYDWYYTDSAHSGHNIIAILPETGTSFWPPQNQIIPLAQGMLFNNQYISLIAGPYIKLLGTAFNLPTYTPGQSGTFKVRFRNKGLMAANNTKIIWTAGNNNITIPVGQFNYNVPVFTNDSASFNFTVSGGAPNNCYIPTTITIKIDTLTIYMQNIYVPVGTPAGTTVFNDQGGNFSNWTTDGTWNITTAQYNTPPSSFTDSPGGNYQSNTDYNMTMINAVNVSNSQVIYLSFFHRYATELNHDFCFVEISSNNGSSWQTVSQYSGTLGAWTQQIFDITSFTNFSSQVKIRFRLMSDASTTGDGWYIDDIVLTTYCTGQFLGISSNNLPYAFSLEQNYPNPFNPVTQIKYSLAKEELVKISVYDILGRKIINLVNGKQKPGSYEVKFDGTNFASGLYFYKIEAGNYINVRKMMLIK